MKPKRARWWTPARAAILSQKFQAGESAEAIADALRITPGQVRHALRRLGLADTADGPGGECAQYDERVKRAQSGDLKFKRAMLAARERKEERFALGVVCDRSAHYIPKVSPPSDSGYRSSAGFTADMGQDNRGRW